MDHATRDRGCRLFMFLLEIARISRSQIYAVIFRDRAIVRSLRVPRYRPVNQWDWWWRSDATGRGRVVERVYGEGEVRDEKGCKNGPSQPLSGRKESRELRTN